MSTTPPEYFFAVVSSICIHTACVNGAISRTTAALLMCLCITGCGGSRDKALASAAESIDRQARSAAGAFDAELARRSGGSFVQSRPALRKVLADNSSARGAVVADATSAGEWQTVVLYSAQRPYSRGFSSDELLVGGCVEYRVSVATLTLNSARSTACPATARAGLDQTVRVKLQRN